MQKFTACTTMHPALYITIHEQAKHEVCNMGRGDMAALRGYGKYLGFMVPLHVGLGLVGAYWFQVIFADILHNIFLYVGM